MHLLACSWFLLLVGGSYFAPGGGLLLNGSPPPGKKNCLPLSGVAEADEKTVDATSAAGEVEDSAARTARLRREYEEMMDPSRHHTAPSSVQHDGYSERVAASHLGEKDSNEKTKAMSSKAFGLIMVVVFALTLINIVAFWILLERGGHPGFGIIIPTYNIVLLSRLGGFSGWWCLWMFIPFIGPLFWSATVHFNIAKNFDRSSLFALGAVFLPYIFFPIIAFGKNR